MRILMALGVGLVSGLVVGIAFVWAVARNASRKHPEAIHIGLGLVPTLVAALLGFGVGVGGYWLVGSRLTIVGVLAIAASIAFDWAMGRAMGED